MIYWHTQKKSLAKSKKNEHRQGAGNSDPAASTNLVIYGGSSVNALLLVLAQRSSLD